MLMASPPSPVDLRHLVAELRESCVGLRLANLYDVTPKVYMLKFARPDHKVSSEFACLPRLFHARCALWTGPLVPPSCFCCTSRHSWQLFFWTLFFWFFLILTVFLNKSKSRVPAHRFDKRHLTGWTEELTGSKSSRTRIQSRRKSKQQTGQKRRNCAKF